MCDKILISLHVIRLTNNESNLMCRVTFKLSIGTLSFEIWQVLSLNSLPLPTIKHLISICSKTEKMTT